MWRYGWMLLLFVAINGYSQSNTDTFHITKSPNTSTYTLNKLQPAKPFNFSTPAPNYYTQHLGFFCRQELKMEKLATVPVLIRVGSVSDCNYLEQKPGYKTR